MKYLFLPVMAMIGFLTVHAQTDSLKQYTGTYKFPVGSPVTEVTVSLDSSGLTANSAMGSTELKKIEGDVFEIVAYGGTASFKRNGENKISGVQILVGDINMEGTKTEGLLISRSSIFTSPFYCYHAFISRAVKKVI
ncbi:MAG TPA: DUF3471 domain-containing protein [Chitinophagaceae bacterium]